MNPLLAGLLEVDAEPEVVLDLDEEVGEPDRTAAGIQPAVELGEAVGLRRVGLLGRVRLQPPPVVVERDLAVVSPISCAGDGPCAGTIPAVVSPQTSTPC